MVADTFKITECVQNFGDFNTLLVAEFHGVQANQITADLIFILVDAIFTRFHSGKAFIAVIGQQGESLHQILT